LESHIQIFIDEGSIFGEEGSDPTKNISKEFKVMSTGEDLKKGSRFLIGS